jgi:hypothetical protein
MIQHPGFQNRKMKLAAQKDRSLTVAVQICAMGEWSSGERLTA